MPALHTGSFGRGLKVIVLACASAASYVLVIFKSKNLVKPLLEGEVDY